MVHIASHGQFDSDPKNSFLLTYNGKITMDDLEQYMKLTRFRDLVAHFYELLRADTSKVAALQLAQKRMLTDPRFRHPSYWAPFLLIGNWL